jgi:hypothetical protein
VVVVLELDVATAEATLDVEFPVKPATAAPSAEALVFVAAATETLTAPAMAAEASDPAVAPEETVTALVTETAIAWAEEGDPTAAAAAT